MILDIFVESFFVNVSPDDVTNKPMPYYHDIFIPKINDEFPIFQLVNVVYGRSNTPCDKSRRIDKTIIISVERQIDI
jgi:hypothetical protein